MGTKESGLPSGPLMEVFENLIAEQTKTTARGAPLKFVKWIKDVPVVALPPENTICVSLSLEDRALIGKFIGLWPSPKTTES